MSNFQTRVLRRSMPAVFSALTLQLAAQCDSSAFNRIRSMGWEETFCDSGEKNWQNLWSLDGEKARVSNDGKGRVFRAGPVPGEDASHSVLWTRQVFEGNVMVEYEYTRLDSATKYVNIIYLLASGSGSKGFPNDILAWSDKREVPAMKMYYNHMNLLHISYAAFENTNDDPGADYIRARRYLPETGKGLQGTGLKPDYEKSGFFAPGKPCRITVIKYEENLFMKISGEGREMTCHWDLSGVPDVPAGRIGLREMGSRSARYDNFRVSQLK